VPVVELGLDGPLRDPGLHLEQLVDEALVGVAGANVVALESLPVEALLLYLVVQRYGRYEMRAVQACGEAGALAAGEVLDPLRRDGAAVGTAPGRTRKRVAALGLPLGPLVASDLLREAVVTQDAGRADRVVEKVGRLDVAVDDGLAVRGAEGAEEGRKVGTEERERRVAVVRLPDVRVSLRSSAGTRVREERTR
jgi:hypothetical protein